MCETMLGQSPGKGVVGLVHSIKRIYAEIIAERGDYVI